jgi:hypothetical protein
VFVSVRIRVWKEKLAAFIRGAIERGAIQARGEEVEEVTVVTNDPPINPPVRSFRTNIGNLSFRDGGHG